jgi:hydroxylamine dehydrogenase
MTLLKTARVIQLAAWTILAVVLGSVPAKAEEPDCVSCHKKATPAIVMEWEHSRHSGAGVGCYECHRAEQNEPDAWKHQGQWISTLVTPADCGGCHSDEAAQFVVSHHARAGEIIQSLDNVIAERICGMPGNNADAVNGCWQCHGSIVGFRKDASGAVQRGAEGRPLLDPATWPNSGVGRLNPDGSRGSCHACHSRHDFNAALARAPENCGKCHMGPDHPQIEIYNESKHGIAFAANRGRMALDKDGDWVLGRDYSAAPTCATCHMGSYLGPDGIVRGNSHDVGERISWTLRPVVSTRLNMVLYEDGTREDYPETRALPKVGEAVKVSEKYVADGKIASRDVEKKVAGLRTWEERRDGMKGVCANCHAGTHVDNFYEQFDDLVGLYNVKFAVPARDLMSDLEIDEVLNPRSPFGEDLGWTYYELWHHEGRRARHGASMMGPDYTHWHGMYEVAKCFYTEFLPGVVATAERKSPAMGEKYGKKVSDLLEGDAHLWKKGMTAAEIEAMRKEYQQRYQQRN